MGLTLSDILRGLLIEGVSEKDVLDAIHNKYYVRIRYDDSAGDGNVNNKLGSRVIQPAALGSSVRGNPVLRAFQLNGASKRGAPKWKFFRLDRIMSWSPMRNKTFNSMPDGYNHNGDGSMISFIDNVKVNTSGGTLDKVRADRNTDTPKMSVRNVKGPVRADKQWSKNVFTSQPSSKKYQDAAKAISDTVKDAGYWSDYDKASDEASRQVVGDDGALRAGQPDDRGYELTDTDFNKDDFTNTNTR